MADVFGKIKNSLDKGVATVSIKSNEFVESTKIKTQVSNVEKEVESQHRALGKVVYRQWLQGNTEEEGIVGLCEEIKKNEDTITELQEKLIQMQEENKKILQSEELGVRCGCGEMNKAGAKFCINCGEKLEEPVQEDYSDKIPCTCGTMVKKTAKFCPGCGNPVVIPEETAEEGAEQTEIIVCSCGQELPKGSKFCGTCGAEL